MENKLQIGWKLVKEYPFQNIGDIIEMPVAFRDKIYKFKNTGIVVDEKLLNSPLFKPYYFELNVGEDVIYKNFNEIRLAKITKIDGENVSLKFYNDKPKTKIVNFRKVSKCISYWYFNSFLQPCQISVGSKGKMGEMQQRIELGNYFETKAECQEIILKIKEELNKKV